MMKKVLSVFLIMCLILAVLPAFVAAEEEIIAGGEWDVSTVQWKITADGTLTISGNRSVQEKTHYTWKDYSHIITKIVVEDGITSIPKEIFSKMTNVKSVYLGNTLVSMGERAFLGCSSLTSITIPAKLKEISYEAFWGCSSLKEIIFVPGCEVTTIAQQAFAKTGLEKLVTPPSLKTISAHAFSNCESLETVIIKDGVVEVLAKAFEGCKNLKELYLSETITNPGGYMFRGCDAIEKLELNTNAPIGSFENQTKLEQVVVGGNRTKIGSSLFKNCTSLTSVTISAPITEIGGYAFQGCTSLTELILPDTLQTVDTAAFAASGITKLSFPKSLKQIVMGAFPRGMQEIVFTGDAPKLDRYNAFNGIVATVYYPANNATWTEDKLQDYGGTITWVPWSCNGTHTPVTIPGKRATCTKTGLTDGSVCYMCGEVLTAQKTISITSHTEMVISGMKETCISDGMTDGKQCVECGKVLVAPTKIPATGHSYGEWVEVRAPTVEEMGLLRQTCSVCNDQKNQMIDRLSPSDTNTQPTETQPAVTEPAQTDPIETAPVETDPAGTTPTESQPAETDPVETLYTDPTVLPTEVESLAPTAATQAVQPGDKADEAKSGIPWPIIIAIVVVVLVGGGAGYYFIKKRK